MKKLTKEQKLKQQIQELDRERKKMNESLEYYRSFHDEMKSMFDSSTVSSTVWDADNSKTLITKISEYRMNAESFRRQHEGANNAFYIENKSLREIVDALINPEILNNKYLTDRDRCNQ